MNTRIKELRKKLGLTQQEFANKLNIKRGAIANYEIGRNDPIDAVVSLICKEFNVNEDWLRTGNGGAENMFIPEDMIYYHNVGKLGSEKNEFKKFYLNMLMNLPEEYWNYIYQEFKKFEEKKGE